MIYGIISDIHGNYDAFETVIDFLEKQKVDQIINCGDIIRLWSPARQMY